jgi:hypothetical protein
MSKSNCNYAQLGNYNNLPAQNNAQAVRSSRSAYIIPSFGSIPGYNALTHDSQGPSCDGYFDMKHAYPGSGRCATKYVQSMCQ